LVQHGGAPSAADQRTYWATRGKNVHGEEGAEKRDYGGSELSFFTEVAVALASDEGGDAPERARVEAEGMWEHGVAAYKGAHAETERALAELGLGCDLILRAALDGLLTKYGDKRTSDALRATAPGWVLPQGK
jgi:uncharacterized protein YbjT (DUF2867 family)